MSPHPARIFVFLALLLAWLFTARAALAQEPAFESLDELNSEGLDQLVFEERLELEALADHPRLPELSWAGRGSATLSASAFAERRSDGFREIGGMLMLGIPLERFALPRASLRLASLRSDSDEEDENLVHSVSVPLPRALPRLSSSVARACVLAAMREQGLADDERLDSLASRARASAALPDLRLRASRATDASLRLSPTQYDPYRYTEGEAAGQRLEATVSFRLDRLLFADQEVALERIRLQRLEARSKLVTRVLRALFDWQRAKALEEDEGLSPEEQISAHLRALEAEATLSVLTGGGCLPADHP